MASLEMFRRQGPAFRITACTHGLPGSLVRPMPEDSGNSVLMVSGAGEHDTPIPLQPRAAGSSDTVACASGRSFGRVADALSARVCRCSVPPMSGWGDGSAEAAQL